MSRRRLAESLEERALTGDDTARALEGLDDDGRELMRMLGDQAGGAMGKWFAWASNMCAGFR